MSGLAGPASSKAADLVAWAENRIAAVTDCSRLEAELLLAESAGLGRAALMAHPETEIAREQATRLEAAVERRCQGEPMAYILGRKEFYSLPFKVERGVLVPRPETETLVEAAVERSTRPGSRVLDLGTGSGAIALTLKHARPDCEVTAVDVDRDALAIAIANGARLGLEVRWLESNWFAALVGEEFDLIVSNPPYVASADPHFESGLAHEPRIALDGGADGLDAYRQILGRAAEFLAPRGVLLFEHGFDQRPALIELARVSGFRLETEINDLAGLPRVAVFSESTA
jgi:release factor glutamine methyltransferase